MQTLFQSRKYPFEAYIYVENGYVVEAHFEDNAIGGGGYSAKRYDKKFISCLKDCMLEMIDSSLNEFKRLMQAITNDEKCYTLGKNLLEEKRNKLLMKLTL